MNTDSTSLPFDEQVRLAVYDGFVHRGQAPTAAQLADSLGRTLDEVAAALRELQSAHLLVLQPDGEVLMANPFSAVATGFRVEAGEQAWWANCVWDALGVAAMLRRDVRITTTCLDCGELMTLTVEDGHLRNPQGVIHFAIPARQWWDDIVFT